MAKGTFIMFGSGNFALGSVLALPNFSAYFNIVLATRRPTNDASRRRLNAIKELNGFYVRPDGSDESFFVRVSEVLTYEDQADFFVLEELMRGDPAPIIGTSVGKVHQPDIARQISRLVTSVGDPDASPIVVFRFENEIHSCWDDPLTTDTGRRIYLPSMVVDRICRNMNVVPNESGSPRLEVRPEAYRRIDVQLPDLSAEPTAWTNYVARFVEAMKMIECEDIEPYALLKAWNINGAQAALCAYARMSAFESLQDYFRGNANAEIVLRNISNEFLDASLALLPQITAEEIIDFASSSYKRIRSADDSVSGILHQWESDITNHQNKLQKRIVPVLAYLEANNMSVLRSSYRMLMEPPPVFRRDQL